MLFSNNGELTRIQCALVDTPEVERIVEYISKQQSYTSAYNLPDYTPDLGGGEAALGSESSAPVKYDSKFAEIARDAVSQGADLDLDDPAQLRSGLQPCRPDHACSSNGRASWAAGGRQTARYSLSRPAEPRSEVAGIGCFLTMTTRSEYDSPARRSAPVGAVSGGAGILVAAACGGRCACAEGRRRAWRPVSGR